MNASEINASLLHPSGVKNATFEEFAKGEENGWYAYGVGPETRPESEERVCYKERTDSCSRDILCISNLTRMLLYLHSIRLLGFMFG